MKSLSIFFYEWKHFVRSPFKIVAILLFIVAGIYGLHKGASLYNTQTAEITKIEDSVSKQRNKIIKEYLNTGNHVPEGRPWIDYSTPFWAIWYSSPYHFKKPSPSMVYSIGQAEQYGFYKKITFRGSPYDADLAEEIANPERLQTGTLDFSFTLLYLMPLVLLVLLYNLKSSENERGILSIILVQKPNSNAWLLSRVSFYVTLLFLVIAILMFYGSFLTPVLEQTPSKLGTMLLFTLLYLLLWSILFFFINIRSKSILGSTLQMSALYLVFAFIAPATVHQLLSIYKPANLMTDLIDVRDQEEALYKEADSIVQLKLIQMFPEIETSPVFKDKSKVNVARNRSYVALTNELRKASILPIEKENQLKNEFIEKTFWFNPVSFFQNKFNSISETHFDDYQSYRNEIQSKVDKQIQLLISHMWADIKVDEKQFKAYFNL